MRWFFASETIDDRSPWYSRLDYSLHDRNYEMNALWHIFVAAILFCNYFLQWLVLCVLLDNLEATCCWLVSEGVADRVLPNYHPTYWAIKYFKSKLLKITGSKNFMMVSNCDCNRQLMIVMQDDVLVLLTFLIYAYHTGYTNFTE